MIYGDDYDPDAKYILQPKNNTIVDFCKPIERQAGIKPYDLDDVVFNTKNVNTLNDVFNDDSNLKSIDTSSWDTSKVTNMFNMFNSCPKLHSLDLSNWNTSNVTNMANMFNGCSSLTSLDISEWDTSKVTAMSFMFANCSSLTTINGILDFKNCAYYNGIFINSYNITSIKVKNLPTDIDTFCTSARIDKSKVIVVQ